MPGEFGSRPGPGDVPNPIGDMPGSGEIAKPPGGGSLGRGAEQSKPGIAGGASEGKYGFGFSTAGRAGDKPGEKLIMQASTGGDSPPLPKEPEGTPKETSRGGADLDNSAMTEEAHRPRSDTDLGKSMRSIRGAVRRAISADIGNSSELEALLPQDTAEIVDREWRREARKNPDFIKARDELAKKYVGDVEALTADSPHEGAYNAGVASLYEAAEDFDPQNRNFREFMGERIAKEMDKLAADEGLTGMPESVQKERKAVQDAAGLLTQEKQGADPTVSEVTDRVNKAAAGPFRDNVPDKPLSEEQVDEFLTSDVFEDPMRITPSGDIYERVSRVEGEVTDGVGIIKEGDTPDPSQNPADQVVNRMIASLLPGVSTRRRSVLQRHYLEGQTIDEIATAMGISPTRVNQLRKKGLIEIRVRLGYYEPQQEQED